MKLGLGLGVDFDQHTGGAIVIDPDAQIWFDENANAGFPVTGNYIIWYNNLFKCLKTSNVWSNADSIYLFATGDRNWAKRDLKRPTITITTSNDYSGDFIVGEGFKGNGTINTGFRYLVNFNPGDGGTYNFVRNDAGVHFLIVEGTTNSFGHDISSFDAGYTTGTFLRSYPQDYCSINGPWPPTPAYRKDFIQSYSWLSKTRTASNLSQTYYNGLLIEIDSDASTAILNQNIGGLNAYGGGSFAGGNFFSNGCHGALVFGNNSIIANDVINCFNDTFLRDQNTKALIDKMVYFEGDSRTGDKTAPTLSVYSAMCKKVGVDMGDEWCVGAVSKANDTLVDMYNDYPTEIAPYINYGLTERIMVLWGGTNDIAAGASGATVYSRMVDLAQQAKDDGFKVVIIGEIDRNWSNYVVMNAERDAYRTLLLADFDTSVASHIYLPAVGITYADVMIDIYGLTNFQNYLSSWYQVDGIHPDIDGYDPVGEHVADAIGFII